MSSNSINLYYYKYPNIGDILNEILISRLFHIDIQMEHYCNADMMAIGSILDRLSEDWKAWGEEAELRKNADCSKPIHIWGTGMIYHYDCPAPFIRPVKIHALRGDLSRQQVEKATGHKCNCVLADPGLLAPLLLNDIPEKKYDVGIIPHYVDADAAVFQKMKNEYQNSIIIDVKADPMEVLTTMAKCRLIISTSLHGLIIADSFGIPNLWCECSDKILGAGFKYRDYYSSFGLEMEPFDLRNDNIPRLDKIKDDYKITLSQVKTKQRQLLKCFPFKNRYVLKYYLKMWRS
jgi:hypothetical protein